LFNGPASQSQSPKSSLLGLKKQAVVGANEPLAIVVAVGEAVQTQSRRLFIVRYIASTVPLASRTEETK
jgi:hypothetical protein